MTDRFDPFVAPLRRRLQTASVWEPWDNFEAQALALFALQFAHVPAYRKLCLARGKTPENVRHWTEIPALPTRAFKEFELSSLPAERRTRVFYSSGTTGQSPSQHFHGAESLALYEDSLLGAFAGSVLSQGKFVFAPQPACKLIALTPPEAQAPNSSLVYMFETVQRRLSFATTLFAGTVSREGWSVDFARFVQELEACVGQRQPVVLLGTAFLFVEVCDRLCAHGKAFEVPAGSRVMETGGYKGRSRRLSRADLHALISDRFGISRRDIFSEYGMSELSTQAYSDGAGVFQFPAWARLSIISPETGVEVPEGEVGLVQVLDLANAYSVAAVRTEDLARRCGNAFELIGRAPQAEPRGCSLMALSS